MDPTHHEPEPAPAPAPAPEEEGLPARRGFFRGLTWALGAAATAMAGLPILGYVFPGRKPAVRWVPLGPAAGFPRDETRFVTFRNPLRQPWDGLAAHVGVYVRRLADDPAASEAFLVLAANCAHLGCPVSWFPQSGLFMCPCHGGVYYFNGERASGPPPRGLFRCVWKVKGGQLEIQAPHYPTLQDTLHENA